MTGFSINRAMITLFKKNSNYYERPYPEWLWGLHSPFFRGKGD
jgi:hypothetical protein